MIYFSDFSAGGPVGTDAGVLVYVGTDLAQGGVGNITFDSETYDPDGYHSTGSNTDRLTVPSGITRGRLIANSEHNDPEAIRQLKNGASFVGGAIGYTSVNSGSVDEMANFASAIVPVSQGDYFTLLTTGAALTLRDTTTWLAFEPIDASIKGALVGKTTGQSISAGVSTNITWDSEAYDTDAFHDNSTNNSRLTVPSGVSLVRLSACIDTSGSSAGDQIALTLRKNGAASDGRFNNDLFIDTPDHDPISVVSAIIAVTPGDYFEAQVQTTSATTVLSQNETWFQIEEIPSATKYAMAYKNANQSITGGVWTAVALDAELADTDAFHDNSTNNSRMTVPSGCTRARLGFNLNTPSSTAQMHCRVTKNGSVAPGLPSFNNNTAATDGLNGFGAWVDVTPGDYFELEFMASAGLTLGAQGGTWLCIEAE